MKPNEARVALNTGLAILALVGLRLIAAAFTPITFDEAYYWMWSKHLAGGYYDHPPMVAVVIRLGTLIAGDTEFGVRVVSILLADRKSTRLNSSHSQISYAVFCLKKKTHLQAPAGLHIGRAGRYLAVGVYLLCDASKAGSEHPELVHRPAFQ